MEARKLSKSDMTKNHDNVTEFLLPSVLFLQTPEDLFPKDKNLIDQ